MQYMTILSSTLADFDKKVNEFLKRGWKLQGGISSEQNIAIQGPGAALPDMDTAQAQAGQAQTASGATEQPAPKPVTNSVLSNL